ncbi:MAG TPA: hypothetical protein VES69_08115 [Pyrinomonadaceae bacterium]|nr:hypothetical protein [Pyrinomonadaceae bacterium]
MDAKELPARPNLEQYKKQAKELVKARYGGTVLDQTLWSLHNDP